MNTKDNFFAILENIKDKIFAFFENKGPDLLTAAVILIVGLIIIKFLIGALKKGLKRSKLDPICHKFIISLSKIFLDIIVIIMVCTKLGVPMSSLVTILGAAGLAISLAIQDSLSNLAGGFILLFTKPFQVGDFIQIADVSGTVKHINILQTKLDTVDNKAIYIPNGQVSAAKIINYSREEKRRLDLTFSIGYQDDFLKAQKIILDIINENNKALTDPEPLVRMCEHGANSINIAVKVWVKSDDYWDLNYDLLENVKLAFDQNGINIPYNQLDVYIKQN